MSEFAMGLTTVSSRYPHPASGFFVRINEEGDNIDDISIDERASGLSLAWNDINQEYGVVWSRPATYPSSANEIHLTRIGSNGDKRGDTLLSDEDEYAERPSVVWNGSEYGIGWYQRLEPDYRDNVKFGRFDPLGNRIRDPLVVSSGYADSPRIAWTGSEYGLVWRAPYSGSIFSRILFARVDEDGDLIDTEVPIVDVRGPTVDNVKEGDVRAYGIQRGPTLLWGAEEYAMIWEDEQWEDEETRNEGIRFVRMDSEGNKIGDVANLVNHVRTSNTSPASYNPALVWTGSEYTASWVYTYDRISKIQFGRINLAE